MGVFGTAIVLAKSVECDVLQSGRSRVRSRCRTRALTFLRTEGTAIALQTARPSHAPDDHLKIAVLSQVGNVKTVSSLSTFVQNTFTLSLRFPFERPPDRLKKHQIKESVSHDSENYLDCKTIRIFACSSTREQSNKRSGTRLKTDSDSGERRFFFSRLKRPTGV